MAIRLVLAINFIFLLVISNYSIASSELYFVDAYSEVDETISDLSVIIKDMDRENVYRTILTARERLKTRKIVRFAARHPGRIIPAVRTKNRFYFKNDPKYYEILRKQVSSGRFRAMGEVTLYSSEKGDVTSERRVAPNSPQVKATLKTAIQNRWPFIVHIEFEALRGATKKRFMKEFEELLLAYPKHPFMLSSMGQLFPQDIRRLLKKHNNVYFLTMHVNPVTSFARVQSAWIDIFEGEALKPEWKVLFLEYPEHFVFALGNIWDIHWYDRYPQQMQYWRTALSKLPENVAHAVAHGNAERLWHITPKPVQ